MSSWSMSATPRKLTRAARSLAPSTFRAGFWSSRRTPTRPHAIRNLDQDKTVIVYCASGGRSALAGKTLKDMGYDKVFNLGGFKDWAESGGPIDKA